MTAPDVRTARRTARRAACRILLGLAIMLILSQALRAEEQPGPSVNLNTATGEELQHLPGIGPARADAILRARQEGWKCSGNPLTSDSEGDHLLVEIYSIGEKTAQKLVDAGATCDGETAATGPIGKAGSAGRRKFGAPATDEGEGSDA